MPRYFMYIPWNEHGAGDYGRDEKRVRWPHGLAVRAGNKAFQKVFYSTQGNPFHFNDNGADVTIYVRGHGSSGTDYISKAKAPSGLPALGVHSVDDTQVVNGIIGKGLQVNFSGKIKFYNCHSAEPGDNGELSFAARCAALFRQRLYNHAQFFGYNGAIGGTYKYGPGGKMSDEDFMKAFQFAKFHESIGEQGAYMQIARQIIDKRFAHKWVTIMGNKVRASTQRVAV